MMIIPRIIEIIQSLIGTPNNIIEAAYVVYDMQYILAAILLIMTVFTIYGLLLSFVRNAGRSKK